MATKWVRLATRGGVTPTPRTGHVMFKYKRNKVALFGGYAGNGDYSQEVFVLDTDSLKWQRHKTRGDGPNGLAGAAWACVGSTLYLFGGYDGKKFGQALYELQTNSFSWKTHAARGGTTLVGDVPKGRRDHVMVEVGGEVWMIGGWSIIEAFDEAKKLSPLSKSSLEWTDLDTAGTHGPRGVRGHSATLVDGAIYVFGGVVGVGMYNNDVWKMDTQTREWSRVEASGTAPKPRAWHAATAWGDSRVIVFGGCGGAQAYYNDVWVLDVAANRWSEYRVDGEPPAGRCGHTAAVIGSRLLIFGGNRGMGELFNDMYWLDMVL